MNIVIVLLAAVLLIAIGGVLGADLQDRLGEQERRRRNRYRRELENRVRLAEEEGHRPRPRYVLVGRTGPYTVLADHED
ncbi:MAG TPA: hypothetical protein VGD67_22645 [Pseudonocardiaceae bacterium]